MQTKLKILSLQWQRKWLKPSPWHLQPNVLSAVYASGVQPVICQAFFIFFIKSQLLPAFYTVAVRVSARRRASKGRWVQQLRFEATLSPRPLTEERESFFSLLLYVIYRCCMFTCVCVCVVRASSLWCERWQQQYGTLQQWGVHWQAADKQGGSTCQ